MITAAPGDQVTCRQIKMANSPPGEASVYGRMTALFRYLLNELRAFTAPDPDSDASALPVRTYLGEVVFAILAVLKTPHFLYCKVLKQFVLTREPEGDEFVGFGAGRSVNALIFWQTLVHKSRRFGLFGLASDSYFGTPLSVHSWPLSLAALRLLRYRGFTYVSLALIASGVSWIALSRANSSILILIPLTLLSNYCIANIYIGTWELLAWGLGTLCLACLAGAHPALAGLFLGAVVIAHPGVSLLIAITAALFAINSPGQLASLIFLFGMAAVACVWFVVPYLSARRKLGRSAMINQVWGESTDWSWRDKHQFFTYILFAIVAGCTTSGALTRLILALPALILYYNVRINWTFSPYTLWNYMLVLGMVHLAMHPSLPAALLFLVLINPRASSIGGASRWGFDLTPLVLGETRKKVFQLFRSVGDGRVAFELGPRAGAKWEGFWTWYAMASMSYILADQDVDLFNTGYTELGDARLYFQFCQHLRADAGREDFESACSGAGVAYIVAFTTRFRDVLAARGYPLLGHAADLHILPFLDAEPAEIWLFQLYPACLISDPHVELEVVPNEVRFNAHAGGEYVLKYTMFRGWRAWQNGRVLPLSDADPGIAVSTPESGEVILRYAYHHYWTQETPAS